MTLRELLDLELADIVDLLESVHEDEEGWPDPDDYNWYVWVEDDTHYAGGWWVSCYYDELEPFEDTTWEWFADEDCYEGGYWEITDTRRCDDDNCTCEDEDEDEDEAYC